MIFRKKMVSICMALLFCASVFAQNQSLALQEFAGSGKDLKKQTILVLRENASLSVQDHDEDEQNVGNLHGAQYVFSGDISEKNDGYTVSFTISDVSTGKLFAADSFECNGDDIENDNAAKQTAYLVLKAFGMEKPELAVLNKNSTSGTKGGSSLMIAIVAQQQAQTDKATAERKAQEAKTQAARLAAENKVNLEKMIRENPPIEIVLTGIEMLPLTDVDARKHRVSFSFPKISVKVTNTELLKKYAEYSKKIVFLRELSVRDSKGKKAKLIYLSKDPTAFHSGWLPDGDGYYRNTVRKGPYLKIIVDTANATAIARFTDDVPDLNGLFDTPDVVELYKASPNGIIVPETEIGGNLRFEALGVTCFYGDEEFGCNGIKAAPIPIRFAISDDEYNND